MRRCFDLARLGKGSVSPNPLVGSVVVHNGRIIGEGYHRRYGEAHAERNAISAVQSHDRHLLPDSILYISLEPCCHHGRTPPCTDLILESNIRHVVVSTSDPNPLVSGRGIDILRSHGVTVGYGILEKEGRDLIRCFGTYITQRRPHVILKWAQSEDGFIGKPDTQVWLSNAYERIMVHKLRGEIAAILIGTNTAVIDNPELTTRYYPGRNPLRVILDRTGRIPATHHLFDGTAPTLLVTASPLERPYAEIVVTPFDEGLLAFLLAELYARKVQSLLVEGGAQLLNTFLEGGLWDEALVVRTPVKLENGVKAPLLTGKLRWRYRMDDNEIVAVEKRTA